MFDYGYQLRAFYWNNGVAKNERRAKSEEGGDFSTLSSRFVATLSNTWLSTINISDFQFFTFCFVGHGSPLLAFATTKV